MYQAELFFSSRESAFCLLLRDPFSKASLNYENVHDGQGWGQRVPIPLNLRLCLATLLRHRPDQTEMSLSTPSHYVFSATLFELFPTLV